MRDLDEMKLARVIDACGGIDGRVKMQKIVYLLKAMGYDLPFDDFRIRQSGPFSRSVAWAADTLKAADFIAETTQDFRTNELGWPVIQYSYKVSDSVKPLLKDRFDIRAPAGKPPINEVAALLRSNDRKVLEVVATKIYLQREDELEGEALDAELKRLKGHLEDRFRDADDLLADLGKRGWL